MTETTPLRGYPYHVNVSGELPLHVKFHVELMMSMHAAPRTPPEERRGIRPGQFTPAVTPGTFVVRHGPPPATPAGVLVREDTASARTHIASTEAARTDAHEAITFSSTSAASAAPVPEDTGKDGKGAGKSYRSGPY